MNKKAGNRRISTAPPPKTDAKNKRAEANSERKFAALKIGRRELLICLALTIAIFVVYAPVLNHQFINLDDDIYIYDNPMVRDGFTVKGLGWAFTTFHAANWHPLTWLSHMLDSQLFGLNAGLHLLTNLFIHTANTLLLFFLLKRMTGRVWSSSIVAALFALHPLHVESVAWAAERKDVLSAFFGLLSLLAYIRYAKSSTSGKGMLWVGVALALGLMAKPMLVTWPFVMLLLDYWPLGRLTWQPADGLKQLVKRIQPLVLEKLPLFILIIASSLITYAAQSGGGAVRPFADEPLSLRIANMVVSYGKYLWLMLMPRNLGIYYPFSPVIPPWQVIASLAVLICLTLLAVYRLRERAYLFVGLAWFLGTLVPVIGLVQVGGQALADRYTYIPSIGIFILVVWSVADFVIRRRIGQPALAVATIVLMIVVGWLARVQVAYWRDSVTLYQHTLAGTTNNLVVHYNLAHALGKQGRADQALTHFNEVLRLEPEYFDAWVNIGITLLDQGKFADAAEYLKRASEIRPQSGKAHLQLALALAQGKTPNDAIPHFQKALEFAGDDPMVHTNWGLMLARLGKLREAAEELNLALRMNPNSAEAHNNLGLVLLMQGDPEKSMSHFSTALRLKPDLKVAQDNLNRAQAQLKSRTK